MEMQKSSVKKAVKTTAKSKQAKSHAQSPEREQMIAEAAYFHAQQRGFAAGSDLDDWLRAEKEVSQFI
ncbi:hypothetical protein SKTS_23840 [Sulfurimicrobium lacus]|uniref:DUF2934 domain-containing protein n=1 Tax=Sulfurimicrobium lacus TaxID=2715678 RepID=A0A6F8VCP9_9PROT|nr:DUF2934 domain-containing protein [Sulfurimicrobium lacus]BCB27498.1 hypothetical protein SKTS_23840 [Sulfurimicrobium lacus]